MAIENEDSYPSYEVLYKLIRELHIPADSIFYLEMPPKDSGAEEIVRALHDCDERSLKIIRATAQAALESQPRKQRKACHLLTKGKNWQCLFR